MFDNQNEIIPEIEEHCFVDVPCPVCGTVHTLDRTVWEAYNLDGTPKGDMELFLRRYAICTNCGCFYRRNPTAYNQEQLYNIITSPKYQKILNKDIPIADKKLQLMLFFSEEFARTEGLIACYYDKTTKRQEMLERAINAGVTKYNITVVEPAYMPQLHLTHDLFIRQELYLLDLCRRAGYFADAKEFVDEEESKYYYGKAKNVQQYINLQKQLIESKNTKLI